MVLVFIHSTWVVYKKKVESEELMNISKERVISLKEREVDLNQKISRLDTEVGIEEEIRSKFSVTKDNENMVVVVSREEKVATTVPEHLSLWSKFINWFK
jgi:cell division protein FtsB